LQQLGIDAGRVAELHAAGVLGIDETSAHEK
jgi:hypothetical protein